MMVREKTPEQIREEVRSSLTGRNLKAAENLARVYGQWVARLEAHGDPERVAHADVYLTETRRIAGLMRDRGWDLYSPRKDVERS